MVLNNRVRVLITGATGFIGKHLCQHLLALGVNVRAVGRKDKSDISHLEYIKIPDINGITDWQNLLNDVDVVVHLASRVHCLKDKGMQELARYQEVNVQGTQQLAREAVKSNVKRFVYISTIKVNGEKTFETPFRAEDRPRPQDAYGLSKLQGELILQEEARRSGMEWVIIRPVLVYGPWVKGNFRRLLQLAKSAFPLPVASVKKSRSFVSIYNLCHLIECCLTHPHAHGETFLVSDDRDLCASEWIKILRHGLGKKGWVFPFPVSLLKLAGWFTGKRKEVERLTESLQVNIEKTKRLLNWQPTCSVEQAIKLLYESEQISEIKQKFTEVPVSQQS